MKATLLTLAAVAALGTSPAGAEIGVPGSVTGTDGSLTAGCHYQRHPQWDEYRQSATVTGFAVTTLPDAPVTVTCTVTPRYANITVSDSGPAVLLNTTGTLYGGPTTICVDASVSHTIDVQEYVHACRTYQD